MVFNGCDWPIDPACLGEQWDAYDTEVQDRAQALAGATLRRLTGYRVGGCPITVRPCKKDCSDGLLPSFYGAYAIGFRPGINAAGYWINSCGCTTDCSCGTICEVSLIGPVTAITSVKVNGATIDPGDYRIDQTDTGTKLVWTGAGDCPWPACQNMALADTEDGTFSVTYTNSYPVDGLGAYAGGILAVEFAKACSGDKCRLPNGVTSVSRQGVSFEIIAGAFPDGFTGIREVDTYLALWNPAALRQQTQVWSPDLRSARVTG